MVTPLEDMVIEETTEVTLECELTEEATATWRKDSMLLQPGDRFVMEQDGCVARLTIRQVSLDDGGLYMLQVGEAVSSAMLGVSGEESSEKPF